MNPSTKILFFFVFSRCFQTSTEITGSSGEHFTREGDRGVVGDAGEAGEGGRIWDLGVAEVGDSRATASSKVAQGEFGCGKKKIFKKKNLGFF